jgi:xylulose-5-phosphate/fructose-6-phosphate phosphoketolase
VLPILHLNGYKIANPTVLARISREELGALMGGYSYTPHIVEGDDPAKMHLLASKPASCAAPRRKADPPLRPC